MKGTVHTMRQNHNLSKCISTLGIALTFIFCSFVHAGRYVLNTHYFAVSPPVATSTQAGEVEVIELFWYGCPHCYEFEPYLHKWQETKSEKVKFLRLPAILNRKWEPHARTYYTLEVLGEVERLHPVLFDAMHGQGRQMRDLDSIARFMVQQGVDEKEFRDTYYSFSVETKINQAKELAAKYGVTGVPALIANGKYRTAPTSVGGYEQAIDLLNQLIEQESKSASN